MVGDIVSKVCALWFLYRSGHATRDWAIQTGGLGSTVCGRQSSHANKLGIQSLRCCVHAVRLGREMVLASSFVLQRVSQRFLSFWDRLEMS